MTDKTYDIILPEKYIIYENVWNLLTPTQKHKIRNLSKGVIVHILDNLPERKSFIGMAITERSIDDIRYKVKLAIKKELDTPTMYITKRLPMGCLPPHSLKLIIKNDNVLCFSYNPRAN